MLSFKIICLLQTLIAMSLTQTTEDQVKYTNPHIFTNRIQNHRNVRIIITLETLGNIWFTTKVSINGKRLVDYFQTNTTEAREKLHWYRTVNLTKTLDFYGIFAEKPLPYQKCHYHAISVSFFISGYHNVSTLFVTNGIARDTSTVQTYTFIDLQENIRCEPKFQIPRCHDSNKPLHYETTEVTLLRAVFTKRCPMDSFIQYYWTLHDSTGKHLLEFLGGTFTPEFKLSRYRLKVRQQSPLNRLVLLRLNARIVGRRTPLVAMCYLALASQRLYAAIHGGQFRKVFRGKTIYVSGSPSRDLSLPETAVQQLTYEWTCKSSTSQKDETCRSNMGTTKRIAIPAYSQANDQTIRMTLLIRSTFDFLRTAVAMQTISFSSSTRRYIDVNIICVSNCNSNKYTTGSPIHLKGLCVRYPSNKVNKWSWTINNKVVGKSQRLIHVPDKKKNRVEIYLDIEVSHKFRQTSIFHGRSSLNLEKNKGPADSKCNIKPLDGIALETEFLIRCQQSQSKFKPLQYCVGIDAFLIEECTTDDNIKVRLPPTSFVQVKVCDNLDACETVRVAVDVRPSEIEDSESALINQLARARNFLEYAEWQKSFILLTQLAKVISTKEILLVFTDTLAVYQPQTTVQLAHIVRLTNQLVIGLEPLDDMEVNVLGRMFHMIASTFKSIISNNELNTLMDEYYNTMVSDLCDVLDKFSAEWEFIPKAQCRAESESCLNIDNFRNRLEQMSTLEPQSLIHINNWLHAHWKLSTCLFYMGMGTARRLHPQEGPKTIDRSTFTMRMESFDLDLERAVVIESADSMHTLVLTDKLLQELRKQLRSFEVLISVRSHKMTQYWWYPEQESRTQVLVVNAYTTDAIWDKKQSISEPFQFISKLKETISTREPNQRHRAQYKKRSIDFDDPEEDVENILHDNVVSPNEVRMYRTELYGHSVLGITFSQADIDFRVLLRMTDIPKLKDIESLNATCLVRANIIEPVALLLRNRCEKARPVYIYIRADDPSLNWKKFNVSGAYFTFHTEVRSCRIWNYARPEPSWQSIACLPEMNKTVSFGIHCHCNYISDLDADSKPIIAVTMNLKCHLERPVIAYNYQIFFCYIIVPTAAICFIFIQMLRSAHWDKRLYVEDINSGHLCQGGDIVVKLTFGGTYNAGSSANLILSLKSAIGLTQLIVYQDPVYRTFERNSTISFRLDRKLVRLPARLSIGHDNSGIYPHYYCRSVVVIDSLTDSTQNFNIQRWITISPFDGRYQTAKLFNRTTNTPMEIYKWSARFSYAIEGFMGNWYLFQPLIGPWRLGFSRQSHCRWERTCIYVSKFFSSVCIVVIYYGHSEPIACDPSPRKYTELSSIVWLAIICFFASYVVEAVMDLFLRMIAIYG